MAFPIFPPSNSGFDTLLRLLDADVAPSSRHSQHHQARSFSPKFDVRENSHAYELHGELAGIKQEDIDIEFADSDSNTLVIKGKTARGYVKSSDVEGDKKAIHDKSHGEKPHSDSQIAKNDKDEGTIETKRHDEPAYRYWVSERSVGEFQRTFSFPGKIDREGVKADLKNGILTVVVPKAAKKEVESKKIRIGS